MNGTGAQTDEYNESVVSELFHENSKQHRSDERVVERILAMTTNPILMRMAGARKTYPSARKIPLPADLPPAQLDFDQAVLTRRSRRDFSGEPVSFPEAAKLLFYANGVTGSVEGHEGRPQYFRAAPSGGALYPVELYLIALRVGELEAGLYHYDPFANHLARLAQRDLSRDLVEITFTPELAQAGLALILTGISLKNRVKYGERGYRFLLLEAGHIAQNVLLTAHALGLGAVTIGGFVDDELNRLVGVDGVDEFGLYLIAAGRPAISSGG